MDRPTEQEIKLQVPAEAWPQLQLAMSGPGCRSLALQAIYLDTAARDLGRARVGLRVRREGEQWVQTLKAPGAHGLERVEENIALGPAVAGAAAPAADLQRHRSKAARSALRHALGDTTGALPAALEPVFEVQVQRLLRRVYEGRSVIEVALDEGRILAGGDSSPIAELELELVEGDLVDLLALARRWRARWGLWLNTSSKAERGQLLASGQPHAAASGAGQIALAARPNLHRLAAAVLRSCLDQVAANATQVADGSQSQEHVHQLRVGLRRLRTALRELPGLEGQRQACEPALVAVFRALGERRDRTHVLLGIQPLVEAAGGPALAIPPDFHEVADLGALVRDDSFQDALLALLARAETIGREKGKRSGRKALRAALDRLHRQVTGAGGRFRKLPPDQQHRVRKRLKRLRYLSEFAAPLFPRKSLARYLGRLKPAQDGLGLYNDEVMAEALYVELAATDPGARFAVQWLQGRRAAEIDACARALRRLADAQPFWKL